MRKKFFGVLVAVMLVAGACGTASQPSKDPSTVAPGVSPSANTTVPPPPASTEPSAGPVMTDASLAVEVAASGLTEPTAMAFLGPNDFFVTEKSTGQVHHVSNGQVSDPILDLAVNFFDERGLLGIALHPTFAQNGFVYLYWTESALGESGDGMFGADTDEAKALPDLAQSRRPLHLGRHEAVVGPEPRQAPKQYARHGHVGQDPRQSRRRTDRLRSGRQAVHHHRRPEPAEPASEPARPGGTRRHEPDRRRPPPQRRRQHP